MQEAGRGTFPCKFQRAVLAALRGAESIYANGIYLCLFV